MLKKIILLLGLIGIDQTIKLYIHNNLMDVSIKLIEKKLAFTPYLNKDQLSIFNHELRLGIGITVLIIMNLISIGVLFIGYFIFKYRRKEYTNCFFEISFLLFGAGVICSLFDKVIYGGSIDYLVLFKHIYDMKDTYLFAALAFLMIYIITDFFYEKNRDKLKSK